MKNRTCPVCGSKEKKLIRHITFNMPEAYGLPNQYDVVSCIQCGFCYANTTATQEDYDLYYKNCNVYTAGPKGAADKPNYIWLDKQLEKIYENNKKDIQILDIGFGKGEFLEYLYRQGYKNIKGIDPSKDSVAYTREKGLETYVGNIYDTDVDGLIEKVDFVCLWEVLEHLLNPADALNSLKSYLKEDGYIFIAVPDCGSLSADRMPIANHFNQEHINYFSVQTLNNLMEKNSFTNIVFENVSISSNTGHELGVILAIYKLGGGDRWCRDFLLINEIEKYFESSDNKQNEINEIIKNFSETQEPILIWGIGSYVIQLYETSLLKKCNIIAYVDNNPLKIGTTFGGKKVIAPSELYQLEGSIVICSMLNTVDIEEQIKSMGLPHKVYSPLK